MKGMSRYAAVATKIRGMRSHLLKNEDYYQLASKSSIRDVVVWLKSHPSYTGPLKDIDPDNMRRETFERVLLHSVFLDFGKIANFLDREQKRFLDVYATHYDLRLINNIIREIFNKHVVPVDLGIYREIYARSRNFSFDRIIGAGSIEALIEGLQGTIYCEPVRKIHDSMDEPELFDYETALNRFYFTYFWDELNRYHSAFDRETLLEVHGFEIDMLNMIWIYRAKAYYDLSAAEISSFLIPAYPKLRPGQIAEMISAGSINELINCMSRTYYRKYIDPGDPDSIGRAYESGMTKINDQNRKKYPYSFAVIEAYLFDKRTEVENLIKLAESVRYGYNPKLIIDALNRGGRL